MTTTEYALNNEVSLVTVKNFKEGACMKRLSTYFVLVSTIILLATPAMALLKVEGNYSIFAKGTGMGIGLEMPLLPVSICISKLSEANVALSGTIGGKTFTGATKANAWGIEASIKFPLDLMGVSIGGLAYADLATGKAPDGTDVALPGNAYVGPFARYSIDVVPLVTVYGQMAFLIKVLDGQKAIQDQLTGSGTSVDISDMNRSGLLLRFGVSAGL